MENCLKDCDDSNNSNEINIGESESSDMKDDDKEEKCLFEINLNDMLRVFMEQNSQFEFLNRFYENTDSFSDFSNDMNFDNIDMNLEMNFDNFDMNFNMNDDDCDINNIDLHKTNKMDTKNKYINFNKCLNTESIDLYNIYIWRNELNILAIAKNLKDATQQVLNRFLISKQQSKNKSKKLYSILNNNFLSDDGFVKFKNILYKSKVSVFPCKNFSCFF